MNLSKYLTALFLMLCVTGFCMSNVAAKDPIDLKVENDTILFDTTSNYAVTVWVKFYDADKIELPLLVADPGHISRDYRIKNLETDKIDKGAYYMTIYMKPYAEGTSHKTFEMIPVQAATFKFQGCLGSTVNVIWKFADGSWGQYHF